MYFPWNLIMLKSVFVFVESRSTLLNKIMRPWSWRREITKMLTHTGRKLPPLAFLLVMVLFTCTKPNQPDPAPSPTPDPTPTPQITVPPSSQPIFTNGISFNAEEQPSNPGSGGSGGSSEPQAQTTTVNFTAPSAWSASVDATKAVDWLSVEPSSGGAGDVTMKVTAQPNLTYDDRAATVTIKCGNASQSFTVRQAGKPRPIEVTEVKLDQTELTLNKGENVTLVATVLPENATDKTVTWGSSKTSVATVDESGKVTAVGAGEAVISAKAGEKIAECKVTVIAIPATSLTLNRSLITLLPGSGVTLVATVLPENTTDNIVRWSSSNPSVATVDENGTVTALAEGTAHITAQAGDIPAGCTVVVTSQLVPVSSISLNQTNLTLQPGGSYSLIAIVEPWNASIVSWSSSNPNVATVDEAGNVTAVAVGNTVITAQAGDKSTSCTVVVSTDIPVDSVTLSETTVHLYFGGSITLVATVLPEDATDKSVTWRSTFPKVVEVDANGKVTTKAIGGGNIIAQAGDKTASCFILVEPLRVSSLELEPTSLNLVEGDIAMLTVKVDPDFSPIVWRSDKPKVAEAYENGKVRAGSPGKATITAIAGEKTATCMVTVAPLVIPASSVVLNQTSLSLTEGDNVTLTATVGPMNATDKSVSWSSNKPEVATVNKIGKVTAVSTGNATITAQSGGIIANCEVTVAPLVIPVSSIELNRTSMALEPGGSVTLVATILPENATDKSVSWSSNQTGVVTVDSNGKVTAIDSGNATITVRAGDKTATCAVTVAPSVIEVSSIELNRTSLNLAEGESETLTATVKPENATNKTVKWKSDKPDIASVDENGKVTAISFGHATITAASGNVNVACDVTVSVPGGGTEGTGEEIWK